MLFITSEYGPTVEQKLVLKFQMKLRNFSSNQLQRLSNYGNLTYLYLKKCPRNKNLFNLIKTAMKLAFMTYLLNTYFQRSLYLIYRFNESENMTHCDTQSTQEGHIECNFINLYSKVFTLDRFLYTVPNYNIIMRI